MIGLVPQLWSGRDNIFLFDVWEGFGRFRYPVLQAATSQLGTPNLGTFAGASRYPRFAGGTRNIWNVFGALTPGTLNLCTFMLGTIRLGIVLGRYV